MNRIVSATGKLASSLDPAVLFRFQLRRCSRALQVNTNTDYFCRPSVANFCSRNFTTSKPTSYAYQVQRSTKHLKMTTTATTLKGQPLDRPTLDSILRRRMFYTPSFEIYGGVAGLYDYGPPGCSLQANIIDVWRKHFVLEEDMLEVDCSVLTPEEVLKTSGHVDKFADWMCKDPKNGEIIRADHFVEEVLESRLKGDKEARGQKVEEKEEDPKKKKRKAKSAQEAIKLDDAVVKEYEEVLAKIDNYNGEELGELIKKYDLKNPTSGVQPSPPVAFNLMFQTAIGPSSNLPGYLRPETAQGQFLNFSKLLEFNQGQMPFASASIGRSYRNEISPRAGLLRVREFLMAEIEHFVDPQGGKKHPRFPEVKDTELVLLNRETQLAGQTKVERLSIAQAVANGTVDNETLGYFLARIHLFLKKIGVDQSKIRFRQHMANEMAHYAADCWDAELLTSYGWVECVGCADRSAYDLSVHAKKTGAPLIVREQRAEPLVIEEWEVDLNKKKFGPHFKKDGKTVEAAVLATTQDQREALAKTLGEKGSIALEVAGVDDGKVEIPKDLITIERRTRVEHVREYTPNVIEPSFGIGRILYALMEHNFWTRASDGGDEARGVLSFPPTVAPTKVLIVPLSSNEKFRPICYKLSQKLRKIGISNRIDDSSATIGKRYSRNDELGTPLGITVDFQTVQDSTITLRDRDSTKQVRADEDKIIAAIQSVADGSKEWKDVAAELPAFEGQEVEVAVR
ncbi:glycyl-tRNA synthetase [Jackrogersella minutella]|nr:glycyl-tRNA synthetase [Jackrogersella minutella]